MILCDIIAANFSNLNFVTNSLPCILWIVEGAKQNYCHLATYIFIVIYNMATTYPYLVCSYLATPPIKSILNIVLFCFHLVPAITICNIHGYETVISCRNCFIQFLQCFCNLRWVTWRIEQDIFGEKERSELIQMNPWSRKNPKDFLECRLLRELMVMDSTKTDGMMIN